MDDKRKKHMIKRLLAKLEKDSAMWNMTHSEPRLQEIVLTIESLNRLGTKPIASEDVRDVLKHLDETNGYL